MSPGQLDWIGDRVFQNECSGRAACLVHWNEGEAFPSLGIGHFIWYPAGIEGPYVESFPALIDFMKTQEVVLPTWLAELDPFDAPWPSREAFIQKSNTDRLSELRNFLSSSQGIQARYLVQRASRALDRVIDGAPKPDRAFVRDRIHALIRTPGGVFAIVDYVNFKGEGLSPSERYQRQGWGLLQVLQAMKLTDGKSALSAFRGAAGEVLSQRASNAARPFEKERWLPGWLNRLDTYREPL